MCSLEATQELMIATIGMSNQNLIWKRRIWPSSFINANGCSLKKQMLLSLKSNALNVLVSNCMCVDVPERPWRNFNKEVANSIRLRFHKFFKSNPNIIYIWHCNNVEGLDREWESSHSTNLSFQKLNSNAETESFFHCYHLKSDKTVYWKEYNKHIQYRMKMNVYWNRWLLALAFLTKWRYLIKSRKWYLLLVFWLRTNKEKRKERKI